ncbi:MAG: SDR family oxidoreductase [Candidatus Dadabacteria bacterium]|nr:SDR family oxidoreductase [Candidatus Dadabacteria bacterium]
MSKGFVKVALVAVLAAVLSMPWSAEAEEGLLGVEFAFTVGAQVGPFDTDAGVFVAGEIGIPIAQAGPGVFMGLMNIGWSQTDDDLIFEPTINAVAPGPILTPMLLRDWQGDVEKAAGGVPMGRVGQPDEVAEAVVWLCSDRASFITGHVLPIDGGMMCKVG